MNTPAHLIFGLTAFGKPDAKAVTAAALFGAMIPDLSLYGMAGWQLFVLGTEPEIVFRQMYFSEAWQSVFRIDNSFVLWGIAFVLGMMAQNRVVMALCGAALLHLVFDFPLHNNDARAHFWPLSNWVFESPVSYWDQRHYANIVGPIEAAAVVGCCVVLWRRFRGFWMRALIVLLGLFEAVPAILFGLIFNEPQ